MTKKETLKELHDTMRKAESAINILLLDGYDAIICTDAQSPYDEVERLIRKARVIAFNAYMKARKEETNND